MIPQDTLTAKGTVEAIIHLTFNTDSATVAELAEQMNVADGTARTRMAELAELGLVTEDAKLVDDTPMRVFSATDEGVRAGETLSELLSDGVGSSTGNEPTGEDPDGTVDVATGTTETNEA